MYGNITAVKEDNKMDIKTTHVKVNTQNLCIFLKNTDYDSRITRDHSEVSLNEHSLFYLAWQHRTLLIILSRFNFIY